MLEYTMLFAVMVVIFTVLFVIFYLMTSFIAVIARKIGGGVRTGGEEDKFDYDPSCPLSNPLEDECEAYLNRRPL